MKSLSVVIVIGLLLGACTSVELAPSAQDADAKRFAPVPDKSVVYVIQMGGYGSSRVLIQATLNGQHAATLSGDTYARLVLNPGTYRLVLSTPENQAASSFEAHSGDVLYFGARSKIGWTQMRVTAIQGLSTLQGQQAVLDGRLAAPVLP